ncbi:MAG: ABC transporter ATP-binding protein [Pseudomonadales bacterium]
MVQSVINNEYAIDIAELRYGYSGKTGSTLLYLPKWQVAQGEQVFVEGPSGCGKSTLLNLLTGVLSPDAGQICLLGQNLTSLKTRQRDRFRARHIGIVFQQFNLMPYLSVDDNIRLAAHFGSAPSEFLDDKISTLFKHLQLPQRLLQQRADQLSVGQQQRVAIARALVNSPELLVVDEPTSALDDSASQAFMELLLAQSRDNNSTLIFVSHDKRLAHGFDQLVNLPDLNKVVSEGVLDAD